MIHSVATSASKENTVVRKSATAGSSTKKAIRSSEDAPTEDTNIGRERSQRQKKVTSKVEMQRQ
jgi:hypothetical protein